ncbi:8183_t:CDS:1, partial [Rhizophagus irregularis]
EEWNDMIENVPLGKASGLTEIIYEDIKKAPDEFNSLLRKLIDNIFLQQELPEDWKDTNIYLIPKGFRLVNARPITLLEVPKKASWV